MSERKGGRVYVFIVLNTSMHTYLSLCCVLQNFILHKSDSLFQLKRTITALKIRLHVNGAVRRACWSLALFGYLQAEGNVSWIHT